jgi:hypothetical protein
MSRFVLDIQCKSKYFEIITISQICSIKHPFTNQLKYKGQTHTSFEQNTLICGNVAEFIAKIEIMGEGAKSWQAGKSKTTFFHVDKDDDDKG